jgi:plastocyanin
VTGRPPTWLLALVVPVVALIAVLATRAVEGPSSSTVAAAGTNAVVIKKFAFHPPKLTVATGTALKVTNADGTTHTLSARNGSFGTGELGAGKNATIALNQSGTFRYFCKIHNFMTGTLVVK